MSKYTDTSLLLAFLDEAISTFETLDTHVDPDIPGGNDRVAGAVLALRQVYAEVQSGRFAPRET